jgi:translation initiation factor 3 subunit A
MRAVEKRIDYHERAKRLVEIPKLKVHFEKQREQNLRWHEERQHEKREKSKAEHAKNLALKEVFTNCVKNQQVYADALLSERRRVRFEGVV